MTEDGRTARERRVLVLTPTTRDAQLTRSMLARADVDCECFRDLEALCAALADGAGAVVLPEEAVSQGGSRNLLRYLETQPPWSDLPLLVLSRPGATSTDVAAAMDLLGNVTVLERPVRVAALVSAVRTALRARQRQYQLREHLESKERGERILRQTVEELNTLLETLPIGVFIAHDPHCRRITGNRSASELLRADAGTNLSRAPGAGAPAGFRLCRNGVEMPANELPMQRAARGESVHGQVLDVLFDDGTCVNAVVSATPLFDGAGRPRGAVGAIMDITEQKRSELALRDADRRKDEFLAILAHELRNPLAPITNSLHMLRLTNDQHPAARSLAEGMERQVNLMVRLVDDLLEVSRITRGVISLRREPLEIAPIARRVVEANRALIESAGHRLVLDIAPEPLTVDADPARLEQILANLLNNAAKYTDPGGQIRLVVRREGDDATLRVIDTGVGIEPDKLAKVFDLFMQADPLGGRTQGGLGIGLTLVKRLVELHGGRVHAHSEGRGRGSEFVVRLPLIAAAASVAAQAEGDDASLAGRRVLVVDDNRDAADSLAAMLAMLGADTRVAHSGPDAIAVLAGFHPHLAVLDIGMPGMDGHELARRIRLRGELDDVVLVALTGWGQEDDRRRSHSAGFDHHLTKPAALADLRALIASTAEVRQAAQGNRRSRLPSGATPAA